MLHKGEIMSSAILDDPSHENRMSFDDLEQVYKNISRKGNINKEVVSINGGVIKRRKGDVRKN